MKFWMYYTEEPALGERLHTRMAFSSYEEIMSYIDSNKKSHQSLKFFDVVLDSITAIQDFDIDIETILMIQYNQPRDWHGDLVWLISRGDPKVKVGEKIKV